MCGGKYPSEGDFACSAFAGGSAGAMAVGRAADRGSGVGTGATCEGVGQGRGGRATGGTGSSGVAVTLPRTAAFACWVNCESRGTDGRETSIIGPEDVVGVGDAGGRHGGGTRHCGLKVVGLWVDAGSAYHSVVVSSGQDSGGGGGELSPTADAIGRTGGQGWVFLEESFPHGLGGQRGDEQDQKQEGSSLFHFKLYINALLLKDLRP